MESSYLLIPTNYRYVVGSLATVPLFSAYLAYSVIQARKVSGVELPLLFANEKDAAADPIKHKFNCTQKSSMNYQEHAPNFVIASLISGLSFPLTTTAAIWIWIAGRYFYHRGYSTGVPAKRNDGEFGALTHALTILAAAVSGVMLALKL